jgi:glucosamine kinase
MVLIADSGSTKTNWALADKGKEIMRIHSQGMNPFFRSVEDISEELEQVLMPEITREVTAVIFYGAGIINSVKGGGIRKLLHDLFPQAQLEIYSDLLAAARATLGTKRGFACILGTGSNSCFYNGHKVTEHISPLGFILGDEGSGAVLGRRLLGDYLKKVMPAHLRIQFKMKYELTGSVILDRVYRTERPNLFLAGFARFIQEHIRSAYCRNLVKSEFEAFVERNLLHYKKVYSCPVCFTGSIAFYFQEILKEVLKNRSLKCGMIVKDPMEGLLRFHLK